MIGTLDGVVLDCPDPAALARFWADLVGGEVDASEDDWAELVATAPGPRPLLAFQRVEHYRAPEWPGQVVPQQLHLEVRVDDLDAGEAAVVALGARTTGAGGDTYRVFLDPAGHPFCLIRPAD